MALIVFLNLFVLAVLMGLIGAYRIVGKEDQAHTLCVAQAWAAQNEHRQVLKKLLALNPTATSLRLQMLKARRKLAAAMITGNPAVIAAAKAQVAYIHARQVTVNLKQQQLLQLAQAVAARFNTTAARTLQRESQVKLIARKPLALAVTPMPAGTLAPNYVLLQPFSRHQEAGLAWHIDGLKGDCYVTLEQRGTEWHVRLSAGKS